MKPYIYWTEPYTDDCKNLNVDGNIVATLMSQEGKFYTMGYGPFANQKDGPYDSEADAMIGAEKKTYAHYAQ